MELKPGDIFGFLCYTGSVAPVDADALPTARLFRTTAGSAAFDGAAPVTVTHIETGVYAITGIVPATYQPGDHVQVSVRATVAGVTILITEGEFRIPYPFVKQRYTPPATGSLTGTAQALCNDGVTNHGAPVTLTLDVPGNVLTRL